MLDMANASSIAPAHHPIDGKSLLCLLKDATGKSCNWRQWLDLEHTTCYNMTNHWNAIVAENGFVVVQTAKNKK